MELTKQATDQTKESSGVWIKFDDETEFLIGSLNGRAYKKAYAKKIEEVRKTRRAIPADQIDSVLNEAYAEAIILGWKNVQENGVDVPYSVEKAKWILDNCPSVREFVFAAANNNENFRAENLEATKTNAGESSRGN